MKAMVLQLQRKHFPDQSLLASVQVDPHIEDIILLDDRVLAVPDTLTTILESADPGDVMMIRNRTGNGILPRLLPVLLSLKNAPWQACWFQLILMIRSPRSFQILAKSIIFQRCASRMEKL